jgi:hypothetical protein
MVDSLTPEVIAALVTTTGGAISAIIISLLTAKSNRKHDSEIERLKDQLGTRRDEESARREYEYQARKRLYKECEPLLFQLIEASETALSQINGIISRVKTTDVKVFREEYNLKTTAYYLLVPCAVFKMIRRRLTMVDLQVDPMIYTHYILAKSVYLSYTHDFSLARPELGKRLDYNPYVNEWRKKREENPQVYRMQGFPLGRLDNAIDALTAHDEKTGDRFISFGEFEGKFDAIEDNDVNSPLGTAKDIFFEFHPSTRPILWRILIVQALLYRCILELSWRRRMSSDAIREFLITSVHEKEIAESNSSTSMQNLDDNIKLHEPLKIARAYILKQLQESLRLLETITNRNDGL